MANVEADICNLALGRIGSRVVITSLEDAAIEARRCKLAYPHSRDVTLAAFPWPFARARAELAELSETRDGWGYVYAAPTDMVAAVALWPGRNLPRPGEGYPLAIESNTTGDGKVILSDVTPAPLHYTRKMTVVPAFPPHFVDAVVWCLAAELALTLPVKPAVETRARQGYELALARAKAVALNESNAAPSEFRESSYIEERL